MPEAKEFDVPLGDKMVKLRIERHHYFSQGFSITFNGVYQGSLKNEGGWKFLLGPIGTIMGDEVTLLIELVEKYFS